MKAKLIVLLVLCLLAGNAIAQESAVKGDSSTTEQSGAENRPAATQALICPKCHGEMEEGLIVQHYPQTWLSKSRTRLGWWGTHKRESGQPFLKEDVVQAAGNSWADQKVVSVFRCKSCGYLESYAK